MNSPHRLTARFLILGAMLAAMTALSPSSAVAQESQVASATTVRSDSTLEVPMPANELGVRVENIGACDLTVRFIPTAGGATASTFVAAYTARNLGITARPGEFTVIAVPRSCPSSRGSVNVGTITVPPASSLRVVLTDPLERSTLTYRAGTQ